MITDMVTNCDQKNSNVENDCLSEENDAFQRSKFHRNIIEYVKLQEEATSAILITLIQWSNTAAKKR